MSESRVFFGREEVSPDEKDKRVQEVFKSVVPRYDVMNDFMSLGTHRVLKRVLVETTALRPGTCALDVASGTGDITRLLRGAVGTTGKVISVDVNESMLREGRNRSIDAGGLAIQHVVANAERLPFASDSFDAVTIGFGIRNVARKERALAEFKRVLKPDKRLTILDFAKPSTEFVQVAFGAFKRTWPLVGQLVVGSAQPYRYLVDSIATHPGQEVLALMMRDTGFRDVQYDNLLGGIAALHWGTA